jgi:nitroreductase
MRLQVMHLRSIRLIIVEHSATSKQSLNGNKDMHDDFAVLSKLLDERYSCRGYLDQQVDETTVQELVTAASKVPSWCNAQPWKVIVTRGDATKAFSDVLTKAAETKEMEPDFEWPIQYTGDYLDRRRVCGFQLYVAVGIARDDRARRMEQMMLNYQFFGAPHVAIITSEAELGPYGAMDCGNFISMFTIAARAKGVATVAQASVTGFAPTIRKHFNIPENRKIITAISFGYEDPAHPANQFRTERANVADVLKIFE